MNNIHKLGRIDSIARSKDLLYYYGDYFETLRECKDTPREETSLKKLCDDLVFGSSTEYCQYGKLIKENFQPG